MEVLTDDDFSMATERKSPQITLTISQKVYDELAIVAEWKNITLGTLIRFIIEKEHETSTFAALLERALKAQAESPGNTPKKKG